MNGWPFPNPRMDVHPPISRQQLKNRASNGCNAVLSSYSYNQFCPCFPDICSYCNIMLYISCYVKGSHFESGGHWAQVRAMKKNWGGQIWRTWKYNYLHVWEKKHQHGSCNVLAPGFRVRSGLKCWLGTTAQGLAQALSKLVLLFKAGMATSLWEGFISWFRVFLQDPDTSCFLKGCILSPGFATRKSSEGTVGWGSSVSWWKTWGSGWFRGLFEFSIWRCFFGGTRNQSRTGSQLTTSPEALRSL